MTFKKKRLSFGIISFEMYHSQCITMYHSKIIYHFTLTCCLSPSPGSYSFGSKDYAYLYPSS